MNFTIPSASQILNQLLLDYQAIAASQGFTVSIAPGSEIYLRYSSIANLQAVMYNLMFQNTDSAMVDAATGSDLDRLALQYGLVRKGATPAEGFISLISAAPQTLTTTMTLSGNNGLLYQIATNGVYQPEGNANAGYVPVVSVDVGSNTNLSVGSILNWVSLPPNTQSTAPVTVALTGGTDQEDDATLRARLISTLQNPAGAGNASQLIRIASSVDSLVQSAFIYSNYNGAGTQLIALTGYQTSSYIGRDLPHLAADNSLNLQLQTPAYNNYTLPNISNPFTGNIGQNLSSDTSSIFGQIAAPFANQYATAITTVNNAPASVALSLSLPYPVGAPMNGTGGGWLDFTTWPNPDGYWVGGLQYSGYNVPQIVSVQGLVNATATTPAGYKLTIAAATGSKASMSDGYVVKPVAGSTHITWVNRSDASEIGWIPVTATILNAVSNGDNTWTLILDTPLTFGSSARTQTDTFPAVTSQLPYSFNLSELITPSSVSISINGSPVGVDDGFGGISGSLDGYAFTGTIDYTTKIATLLFNSLGLGFGGVPTTGSNIAFAYTVPVTDFYGNTGPVQGDFIFPASNNVASYLNNIIVSFAQLGPGEVTTSQGLIALGASRVPSQTATYSSFIGAQFLQNMTSQNNEIFNASFYYNGSMNIHNHYYNAVSPGSPLAGAPPAIWIPYDLAFYDSNQINFNTK